MVFITGDCHGTFQKIKELTQWTTCHDIVIVCGDFGIWHPHTDGNWQALADLGITVAFCDGNHENFDRLMGGEWQEGHWNGGKVQILASNIVHLMRGEVYTIGQKRFWVMGGARSHDISDGIIEIREGEPRWVRMQRYKDATRNNTKMIRCEGVDWWPQEMPTAAEIEKARNNLTKAGHVDCIITHCAPTSVISEIVMGDPEADQLTDFFQEVYEGGQFGTWFCGHYHIDENFGGGKVKVLYDSITPLWDFEE